jgi:hypothetical protein
MEWGDIRKRQASKDLKKDGRSLFQGVIPTLSWRNRVKPRKNSV